MIDERKSIEESKNVQTTPTRTYCKRNRPLPYYNPNCRTPRHWQFTQHLCTTRPPPISGRLPLRGRKKRKSIDERKKCSNNPHPHLQQAQYALALLLSKLVGRPGTGSLPSTIAPPDHPKDNKRAMMALGRSPKYHWNQVISKSVHRFCRRSPLKLFSIHSPSGHFVQQSGTV